MMMIMATLVTMVLRMLISISMTMMMVVMTMIKLHDGDNGLDDDNDLDS